MYSDTVTDCDLSPILSGQFGCIVILDVRRSLCTTVNQIFVQQAVDFDSCVVQLCIETEIESVTHWLIVV